MTWLLSSLVWLILSVIQFAVILLFRALLTALWLFWPVVLFGVLVASPQSAEAGWFSWLWGSDTRHLERSLTVAQEAARVASQAAEAQAQQAVAQADQNARLAETLGLLSSERSNLADHLRALTELGLKDSQWAAALSAMAPVLVCVTVLLVAGLALWLANRPGNGPQHADLVQTVDLLVEEIAAHATEPTGLHDAREGFLRLGEQPHHHQPAALVGYAGESRHDSADSEQDGEPLPF
jgi:ABC-type multidrug transport system fused ATPase/permease subunit